MSQLFLTFVSNTKCFILIKNNLFTIFIEKKSVHQKLKNNKTFDEHC